MAKLSIIVLVFLALGHLAVRDAISQTTEFTYQGSLKDSANPANGSYDFEFALFDAPAGGSQIGPTITRSSVTVANGIFTVPLDFGSQYPGASRYVEIRVRASGQPNLTTLSPRQQINSTPYSVKSLNADNAANAVNASNAATAQTAVTANNAAQLGGVDSSRYVQKDAGGNVAIGGTLAVNGIIQSTAGGVRFPDGTTQTSAATGGGSLTGVTAGTGLTGGGTAGNVTVSIAPGGVGTTQLSDNAVTNAKISDVSGGKITGSITNATIPGANVSGTVANAANASNAANATTATTANNASQLGGVAASQYVLTGDARLADARNPLPGSSNYIQNNSATQQSSSNFNISGSGKAGGMLSANYVNAGTGYLLGNNRILSSDISDNLFAGGAGDSISTGYANSFFGSKTGSSNSSGYENSFFGAQAGAANTYGYQNSFFGKQAGYSNTGGTSNSFFGVLAGVFNTTGSDNSFFGSGAGYSNNTGLYNSFFGFGAGEKNTSGNYNNSFGLHAGRMNTTGSFNNFFGYQAGYNTSPGTNNGGDNFFGYNAGYGNTTGTGNNFFGLRAGESNQTGNSNTIIGDLANVGSSFLNFATAIGAGATVTSSNSIVLGRSSETVRIPGNLVVSGSIAKGSGSFRIDHPLDPANKYLYHSFVESPDMMNIYNGNVVTDANGDASVTLPTYFEALNRDFRYQLTVIGQFAQAIVLEEIKGNAFKIKTDKPNVKVSWQVTGIRHDKYADDERIKTEENKPDSERGKCEYAPACRNR